MVDHSVYEADVKAAAAVLKAGGTILYPTDTVWGLGCDAGNAAAVEKIFAVKGRDHGKSVLVLLADARDVLYHVAAPPPTLFELTESLSEPTTIIYDGGLHFAEGVTAADGSIGIRVTTDPFCRALIRRFGGPLVSTSANRSGAPAPALFREISPDIRAAVDYVVHWRRDDETLRSPSRIARPAEDGSLIYLR